MDKFKKMDNFFIGLFILTVGAVCVGIGMTINIKHTTREIVTPSVRIVNVDGEIDTTYTYDFSRGAHWTRNLFAVSEY